MIPALMSGLRELTDEEREILDDIFKEDQKEYENFMEENMEKLYFYYNEGKTADGKKYRVPHTLQWGVDMTVQLNGNMKSLVTESAEYPGWYVVQYDPKKAGFTLGKSGYIQLSITD